MRNTLDDFLFSPQLGVLERRDPRSVDLSGHISEHIQLQGPLVSANMDTVTRAEMASASSTARFRPGQIDEQVAQVEIVKRTQHGVKVLRGIASIGAIRDRLDIEDAETADLQALGAEGLETSVPARGSVRPSSATWSGICARR